MILADTSSFLEFFRGNSKARILAEAFSSNEIVLHPYVEGELILRGLSPISRNYLQALPVAAVINHTVMLEFIANHSLIGAGIGYVDCALLATAKANKYQIETFDKALRGVAKKLNLVG